MSIVVIVCATNWRRYHFVHFYPAIQGDNGFSEMHDPCSSVSSQCRVVGDQEFLLIWCNALNFNIICSVTKIKYKGSRCFCRITEYIKQRVLPKIRYLASTIQKYSGDYILAIWRFLARVQLSFNFLSLRTACGAINHPRASLFRTHVKASLAYSLL